MPRRGRRPPAPPRDDAPADGARRDPGARADSSRAGNPPRGDGARADAAAPRAGAVRGGAPAGELIELGYVARAHGLRGELAVVTHDPASTTLDTAPAIWIDGRRLAIEAARDTQRGWLVTVAGVADRTAADALRGRVVWVARADIPMEEGDVLLADLVGCRVELLDGTPWGEVVAVDMSSPQYRLVIHHDGVARELPVVDALIPRLDLAARLVVVAPPDGLPEEPIAPARARPPGPP